MTNPLAGGATFGTMLPTQRVNYYSRAAPSMLMLLVVLVTSIGPVVTVLFGSPQSHHCQGIQAESSRGRYEPTISSSTVGL